jgi:soluble lytic murein transglycosylase-like protein
MSTTLALMFLAATTAHQLPPGLLSAICFIESSHNANAIHHDDGRGDSIGICQIKLTTAKMMGYTGTARGLLNPGTNIKYAALYLQKQLMRYGFDSPKAVGAYNTGTFLPGRDGRFSRNQRYINSVFKSWAEKQ